MARTRVRTPCIAVLVLVLALGGSSSLALERPGRVAPEVRATRNIFRGIGANDPGCSVAVGSRGKVVFAEGYGLADLARSTAITPSTVFDIASTSKQFTATAVLLLVQDGLVDLDAPIARWLPQLPAWASQVTIDNLLHHTSGIPDYVVLLTGAGVTLDQRATQAAALEALATAEVNSVPGERWEYSNSNYLLLAEIVTRASGVDFAEFMADRVFEPLGLAMVVEPTKAIPRKAIGYERVDGEWVPVVAQWEQVGDGAIMTTPRALVRWSTEYWASRLLDDEAEALRLENAVVADADHRYGTGIFVEGTGGASPVLSHSGGWAGFSTTFAVIPKERLAAAVTCNTAQPAVSGDDPAGEVIGHWSRSR